MNIMNLEFDHSSKTIVLNGELNFKEENSELQWPILAFVNENKYFDVEIVTNAKYEIFNTEYIRIKRPGKFIFKLTFKGKLDFHTGSFINYELDSPYIDKNTASIGHGFIPIPKDEKLKNEHITLSFKSTDLFYISTSLDNYKEIPWKDIYANIYISHKNPALTLNIKQLTANFINAGFTEKQVKKISNQLRKVISIIEERFGPPIITKNLIFLMKVVQPIEFIKERKTFTGAGNYTNGIIIFDALEKGSSWPNTFEDPSKNALRYLFAETCHFYFGSKPLSVIYPDPYWEGSFLHEGLNHYIAYRLEEEIGLIDDSEFLKISEYFFDSTKNSHNVHPYSINKYVTSQKNRENIYSGLQYSKGYVVSWWLDQKIKELSNSEHDIFSFAKLVLNKYRGKSYTYKVLLESIKELIPNFPIEELFEYYETDKIPSLN